jgi:cytochrome b subunit of formate dehydrogenase
MRAVKMSDSTPVPSITTESPSTHDSIQRFDLSQRIEHAVFMISFTILGITGIVQKYAGSPMSQYMIQAFGGIEATRIIHRGSAVLMMIVSGYHILSVAYRLYVLRASWSMLPLIEDFKHLFHDLAYYVGMKKHKAYYGRYNYAEKVEYLAVVWGTLIMGITGFMMWNPISTSRWFPGEAIPAAKAAHSGEALLAILAIVIWHFYHVHLRHFNKSMFTGKLTLREMEHEHPGELALIQTGRDIKANSPKEIRSRQKIFFPAAFVFTSIFGFSIIRFISFEDTAIVTIPPGETAEVFVPLPPTPRVIPTALPTPTAQAGISANSWRGSYEGLFRNRCGTCHGRTSVGGYNLDTYQDFLKGGNSGTAVVLGDPESSILVQIQQAGNHPGQLTADELEQVVEWITAGAPEQ